MALIRLPAGTQMSGSIGGTVYSHNRGGPYVRNRSIPTNPQSVGQMSVRNAVQQLSSGWGALTAPQRDSWVTWALDHPQTNRLGEPITWTGHQAYIALNTRLIIMGIGDIATAPVGSDPAPPTSLSAVIEAESTSCVLTFTPTPPTNLYPILRASGLHSTIRTDPYPACRVQLYGNKAQTSPWTWTMGEEAVLGQCINLWVSFMDTSGRISTPLNYQCIVEAGA